MADRQAADSGQRAATCKPVADPLAETKAHLRASAREGIAAARSFADGASDLAERAIDRLARLLSSR